MAYSISKTSGVMGFVDVAFGYMLGQLLLLYSGIVLEEQIYFTIVFSVIVGALFFYIAQ